MASNFYMYFIVALIPLVVGAVWYNPKVLGNAWMEACGFKEEDLQGANMGMIFLLSYVFALLVTFVLQGMAIHQTGVFSMMMPGVMEAGPVQDQFLELMGEYGNNFRTFGHGATHGFFAGLMFALPIIGTTALFERRGWKYIWIHVGYWTICLALMSGVLCQTLHFEL